MGDEYTETVDTSSDMDTSEDFSEDVSADSNDIADDIPEDVPEDSSFDSDDMADDIPEDIPEDVPEDSSADSEDIADDIPEDIPEDVPEDSSADSEDIADDIPEDIPEDAPADTQNDAANEISSDETEDTTSDVSTDEQPAAIQNDMADEAPSDETEDTASDVSADEQPTDSQDDMADEAPSDETEDTASDVSADEQPTDSQDDMADEAPSDETEDTASDISADEQPTDSQDDMADEVPSDETEDTTSDISADERPTDTQNDMERNADTQEDAFLQLSDYMNEHNYGPDDFATYSQDPEWQRLHSNAYPDYTPPEASSADTQENSFRQLSEYMNEHNYGPDDFATYSQDPEWQRLHSNAYPNYTPPEAPSADTQENSFRQLSEYMNEHNYGPDDFATYSQDPEWQQLHSNAYPDYVLPEDSSKGSDIANEAPAHPNEDTAFNISADTQDNINGKIPMAETEDTVLNTQDDMNSDVPTAETEDTALDTQDDMNSDVPMAENGDTVLDTQDAMNSDVLMAETEDTVLDTQGDMDSDVSTSETEDMVPDAYDDQTYDDMDNESPTMEDGANDTNWNPFKPKKETKNAYNWNKNEWEATPVVRDMPPKGNTDSKEYSSMVDALEKANVEYRPIQLAEQGRTEQDIINRLSGGDMTKGSCSSLALAYAGNKAGYDVLDFRDGDSRSFFSSRNSIQTVADMPGVNSTVLQGTNDIATANQLLSGIQAGKEYYLATGGHAAIVRRDGNGYQYLELQHPSNGNGWHNLNDYMLRQRFGCKDSRPYECSSYLMDVDSLANSSEFRNLLGYINTASSSQKKGIYGNVR